MDSYERDLYNGEGESSEEASYGGSGSGNGARGRKKKTVAGKGKGWVVTFAVSMLAAFVGFIVLTVIQDRIVNNVATTPVVVAVAEVPEGIVLTESNMALYFAIENRDAAQVPMGITYQNATGMIGKITDRVIHISEIVTTECFKVESKFDEIEDAVELSLELGSLGQTVSGTLRAGDLVDIMAVIRVMKNEDEALVELEPGLLDVYPEADTLLEPVTAVEGEVTEGESVSESQGTDAGNTVEGDALLVLDENGEAVTDDELEFDLTYGVTGEYVSQLVAENIRVTGVYTSGGEATDTVEGAGGTMIATVVNITVPRALVDSILIAQEEGKITLVKVDEEAQLAKEGADTVSDTTQTTDTVVDTTTATGTNVITQ